LRQAIERFTFRGQPIHPGLIQELLPWLSDEYPTTLSVDVRAAYDSNEYQSREVTVRKGRVELSSGGRFWYERLGVLRDGTQVLRTTRDTGGTGRFMDLLFVRFETGAARNTDGSSRPQLVMELIYSFGLGDRDNSDVRVLSDRVVVSPGKYRAAPVTLETPLGYRWKEGEPRSDELVQVLAHASVTLTAQDIHDLVAIKKLEGLEDAFLREQGGIEAFLVERQRFALWLRKELERSRQTSDSASTSPYSELGCFFLEGDDLRRHYLRKELDTLLGIRDLVRTVEANPVTAKAERAWQQLAQRLAIFWGGNSGAPPPRQTREALRIYRTLAYGT